MDKELHLSFGSATDSGLVNEFNTDAVIEFGISEGHVFVVCDGHNGDNGYGALAAKLLAESIKKYFFNRSYKDIAKALTNAITFANSALFEQSQKDEKYKGIGSTLAILIYIENKLYYAYAGDSRIYLYRNGKLQPLTRDHVADPLNAAGAAVNVLIGRSKDIKFGVCKNPLTIIEDDVYLLCTDGLTDQIAEDEIIAIIGDTDKSPEHKCKNLIDLAKEKGGTDCTSVQVVEFSQIIELQKPKNKINIKPILIGLLGIIVIAALSFGGYKGFEAFKNRPVKEKVVEVTKKAEKPKPEKTKKASRELKHDEENNENKPSNAIMPKPEKKQSTEKKVEPKEQMKLAGEPVYYSHEVKFGENLYRIAIKYNVTQKLLIDINGQKASSLVAGSKIKIPIKTIHTVKNGESFSIISDKYGVKIKLICSASSIEEGSSLKEGQRLVIPISK